MTRTERLNLAGVLLLAACLFFVGLTGRDLWRPDEPRYAEVAREMRASSDWLLPHLNGEVYADKPPGFFWLINVFSFLMRDDGNMAAKVPSAILSLGTLLLTYLLARRLFSHKTGIFSALVLATSFEFVWLSQRANIDASLTFFTTLAIFGFFNGYTSERAKNRWYLLFFLAIAAATLFKGPVGFIIPSLVALFTVLKREGFRGIRLKYLFWGAPLFVGVVFAWLIPACFSGGGKYTRVMLLQHVILMFVSTWSHRQPFYYYFEVLPVGLAPYSLLIPALLYQLFRRDTAEERNRLWFPVIWFLAVFIFFSLSSAKRELYLLPLYPAAAIIIGRFIDKVMYGERSIINKWVYVPALILFVVTAFAGACYAVAPFVAPMVHSTFMSEFPTGQARLWMSLKGWGMLRCVFCGLLLLSAAVWGAKECIKKHGRQTALAFLTVAAAISLMFSLSTVRIGNSFKSTRFLGETVRQVVGPTDSLICFDVEEEAINFYSGRLHVPNIQNADEFVKAMSTKQATFALITQHDYDKLKPQLDEPPVVVEQFLFGHHAGYLVANKAASASQRVQRRS